jgi:hypothetical protein
MAVINVKTIKRSASIACYRIEPRPARCYSDVGHSLAGAGIQDYLIVGSFGIHNGYFA